MAAFSPARERSELERHLLWAACCLGFLVSLDQASLQSKTHDTRHRCCPQIWLSTLIPTPRPSDCISEKRSPTPSVTEYSYFLARRDATSVRCLLCSTIWRGEGPLLRWGDRSPLHQDRFVQAVKAILRDAGIDPSITQDTFPNRGRLNHCGKGHPRPLDQDARSMEVRGLPAICPHPSKHPCCYIISASCGRSGAHVAIEHMNYLLYFPISFISPCCISGLVFIVCTCSILPISFLPIISVVFVVEYLF